jgi:hypothetical protein
LKLISRKIDTACKLLNSSDIEITLKLHLIGDCSWKKREKSFKSAETKRYCNLRENGECSYNRLNKKRKKKLLASIIFSEALENGANNS